MQLSFRSRKRERRWSSLFAACISGFSAFAEDDGNRNAGQINSDLKPRRVIIPIEKAQTQDVGD